jgi:hypothetical protein
VLTTLLDKNWSDAFHFQGEKPSALYSPALPLDLSRIMLDERALYAIACCMEAVFPEQVAQLLLPSRPVDGALLVSAKARARIQETSVFLQKLSTDEKRHAFFALSITQLPGDMLILEKLHPTMRALSGGSFVLTAFEASKVGDRIATELRHFVNNHQRASLPQQGAQGAREFQRVIGEEVSKWLIHSYDAARQTLKILARKEDQSSVHKAVAKKFDEVGLG